MAPKKAVKKTAKESREESNGTTETRAGHAAML